MFVPDTSVSWYSLINVPPSRRLSRGRIPVRSSAADDSASLFSPRDVFFFLYSPPDLEPWVAVDLRGEEGLRGVEVGGFMACGA